MLREISGIGPVNAATVACQVGDPQVRATLTRSDTGSMPAAPTNATLSLPAPGIAGDARSVSRGGTAHRLPPGRSS